MKDAINKAENHFKEDIVWEIESLDVINATTHWPSGSYSEVTFSMLIRR